MKRLSWTAGLLICLAWAGTAWPSETRVDSTGGLTSILTDETTDLSFFMDGNPAGLLLLDTHERLDEALQWGSQNGQPVETGSYQQTFSSIPRLANDNDIRYAGWMAFPASGWAFQAAGDFLTQSGQTSGVVLDSFTPSQYRGVLRGATSLGPLVLGLEVRNMETDVVYDQGLYSNKTTPYTLQNGSSTLNQTFLRAGLATTFPEGRGPNDGFWQAGGVFEVQVAGGNSAFNSTLVYSGGPFSLQQNNALTDYYYFGPELRYELPHRVILRFSYFMIYNDTDFDRTVSQTSPDYANLTRFHSSQFQSMNATGSFKLSFPLSGRENLKVGGFISSYFNNTDDIGPAGLNVTDTINRQQILTNLGVGVEAIHDYTLGIQFSSQTYTLDNTSIASAATTAQTDYNYYQLTLGGERWLDDHFAFRLGLTGEEDQYFQASNLQNLVATLNTGVGWEDTSWACDLRLWVGEQTNLQDSTNEAILDGFEISGTVFL